jgi:hypothetical protein
MNKFKLQLSGFDIGMIIAFVVVGLMGGGAWWYLSGQLQAAQQQDQQVKTDYDGNSVKSGIIVSAANAKTLKENGDLLKAQVDPIIGSDLLAKGNGINAIGKEDPVAWKHDLDEDVRALTTDARSSVVALPADFYFGFSRYLTESPSDESTAVLSKQRTAIKAIAEILINAKVNSIDKVRRTYEEDPHAASAAPSADDHTAGDQLGGYAVTAKGGYYVAYPFEFDFNATAETLRPVIDELIKSPYVFVVRTVEVHNDKLTSPTADDLAKMAVPTGGAAASAIDAGPGGVAAAAAPTVGPQYLFGNSILHVKIRVDMIEWKPVPTPITGAGAKTPTTPRPGHP